MLSKRINSNIIWLIVVSLFLIVFILLIITAFGQLYYNSILDEQYNKIVYNQKKDINKKLNETVIELEKKLEKEKEKNLKLEEELKIEKDRSRYFLSNYEALVTADKLYREGDYIQAATELKGVNKEYLLPYGRNAADIIELNTFHSAAVYFYELGNKKYDNKQYPDAIDAFKRSIFFQRNENFNEESLYMLGVCYYNIYDKFNTLQTFDKLYSKYPESKYINSVEEIRNSIK